AYSTATGRMQKNIAVTMRTPGNDEELAAGFLFTEGIIKNKQAIDAINQLSFDENRTLVTLNEGIQPVLVNVSRNFYSTSSCGVCGKASIEAIRVISDYAPGNDGISVNASVLFHLQDNLRDRQLIFVNTGGLHASALFTCEGSLM